MDSIDSVDSPDTIPAGSDRRASARPPRFTVVGGDAAPDEVAAVATVLATRSRPSAEHTASEDQENSISRWRDHSSEMSRQLPRGRDTWRAALHR